MSSKPGFFVEDCLQALQSLSTINSDFFNWPDWLENLAARAECDLSVRSVHSNLLQTSKELHNNILVSPSNVDLCMAAAITEFLFLNGYQITDLPKSVLKS